MMGRVNVKQSERITITLILCLTLLAAVWLHGILNRYEVIVPNPQSPYSATRYDRITGRAWWIYELKSGELGVTK
jgi:hypothetical protein